MTSTTDHHPLLEEAVDYFKQRQGLHRLLVGIKKKYQSLNALGGTVILLKLTDLEKEHLGLLLNRSLKHQQSLSIKVSKIEKLLQETRYAEVDLKAILEAYFGEALIGNKLMEQSYKQEREAKLEQWLNMQQPSSMKDWLSEQLQTESSWRSWVFQKYRENQDACLQQLTILLKSLNHLTQDHFQTKKIAQFAAEMTGNPHYFDVGSEGEKLLTMSLSRLNGGTLRANNAEGRNELYLQFGLLNDTLSNYTFCYQIEAFLPDGQCHPGIAGYNLMDEPQIVTLESISRLASVTCHQQRIFVVENPTIFHNLINDMTHKSAVSLMCTNGQLTIASLMMLDLIVQSGATLYYSGDFDPEGLRIAQRLKDRYSSLVFWRYTPEDYRAALSEEALATNRLKKLAGLQSATLTALADLMESEKRAGYQETIYQRYLDDIETLAAPLDRVDVDIDDVGIVDASLVDVGISDAGIADKNNEELDVEELKIEAE